jgi:hypothetical protein
MRKGAARRRRPDVQQREDDMDDRRVMRLSGVPIRADVFTARVYARLAPDARPRVRSMATRSVSLGRTSTSLADGDGTTPPMPGMDVAEATFHQDGVTLSCELVLERGTQRGWRPIVNERDMVWVGTLPESVAAAAVGRDAGELTGLDLLAGKTVTNVEVARAFVRVEYGRVEVDLMEPDETEPK